MASPVHKLALRYIDALADRVEESKYPSGEMMDRLERALILFWEEERLEEDRHADSNNT